MYIKNIRTYITIVYPIKNTYALVFSGADPITFDVNPSPKISKFIIISNKKIGRKTTTNNILNILDIILGYVLTVSDKSPPKESSAIFITFLIYDSNFRFMNLYNFPKNIYMTISVISVWRGGLIMKHKIRGTTLQVLDIQLEKGESMYTESGGMAWMSSNVNMETNVKGGLFKGIGRIFGGESLFLTTYSCEKGTGLIAFTNEFPGKILTFDLKEGESLICQKDAFMCAETTVDLSIHFRKKLGAGFFGGEGFIMQKLTGPGKVFLEIEGEITQYELKDGQMLKIDPGHIALFEPSVKYDIARVRGFRNIFFGGEGLFLATITGPGKLWLQSMPLPNLAKKLGVYIPKKGGSLFSLFNL